GRGTGGGWGRRPARSGPARRSPTWSRATPMTRMPTCSPARACAPWPETPGALEQPVVARAACPGPAAHYSGRTVGEEGRQRTCPARLPCEGLVVISRAAPGRRWGLGRLVEGEAQ